MPTITNENDNPQPFLEQFAPPTNTLDLADFASAGSGGLMLWAAIYQDLAIRRRNLLFIRNSRRNILEIIEGFTEEELDKIEEFRKHANLRRPEHQQLSKEDAIFVYASGILRRKLVKQTIFPSFRAHMGFVSALALGLFVASLFTPIGPGIIIGALFGALALSVYRTYKNVSNSTKKYDRKMQHLFSDLNTEQTNFRSQFLATRILGLVKSTPTLKPRNVTMHDEVTGRLAMVSDAGHALSISRNSAMSIGSAFAGIFATIVAGIQTIFAVATVYSMARKMNKHYKRVMQDPNAAINSALGKNIEGINVIAGRKNIFETYVMDHRAEILQQLGLTGVKLSTADIIDILAGDNSDEHSDIHTQALRAAGMRYRSSKFHQYLRSHKVASNSLGVIGDIDEQVKAFIVDKAARNEKRNTIKIGVLSSVMLTTIPTSLVMIAAAVGILSFTVSNPIGWIIGAAAIGAAIGFGVSAAVGRYRERKVRNHLEQSLTAGPELSKLVLDRDEVEQKVDPEQGYQIPANPQRSLFFNKRGESTVDSCRRVAMAAVHCASKSRPNRTRIAQSKSIATS